MNIGDALMRWSDDRLKSNYHRVRMPTPGEDQGSRYSMAYFNQVQTHLLGPMQAPMTHLSHLKPGNSRDYEYAHISRGFGPALLQHLFQPCTILMMHLSHL